MPPVIVKADGGGGGRISEETQKSGLGKVGKRRPGDKGGKTCADVVKNPYQERFTAGTIFGKKGRAGKPMGSVERYGKQKKKEGGGRLAMKDVRDGLAVSL